jgi:hypothetical protein
MPLGIRRLTIQPFASHKHVNQNQDVVINDNMIAIAERAGACFPAITWLREKQRTIQELVNEHPDYAGWALQFSDFTALLTPDQFDTVLRCSGLEALRSMECVNRMSDAQFERCVCQYPEPALERLNSFISDELFAKVVERAPYKALSLAPERLTDSQLDYIVDTLRYYEREWIRRVHVLSLWPSIRMLSDPQFWRVIKRIITVYEVQCRFITFDSESRRRYVYEQLANEDKVAKDAIRRCFV